MAKPGWVDEIKGRVKEAAGALLDDDDLRNRGKLDRTAGAAKEKAEDVVDTVRDALTRDDPDGSEPKR